MTLNTLSKAQREALLRLHTTGEIGNVQWRTMSALMQRRMIYFDKRARVLVVNPETASILEEVIA